MQATDEKRDSATMTAPAAGASGNGSVYLGSGASASSSSASISVSVPAVLGRTASGGFKTSDGTLYVSKPYRSRTSKKLKAMIAFTPRKSAFDTTNELSGVNEFRGFFSLFWISMFIFTVRTYVRSLETHGYVLEFAFARKISQDAITLALSDALLIVSTGICVPFAHAVSKGWIRYYWTGVVIQHLLQALILGVAVTWTFNRQWPWVQSGFLTLHSLVLLMKMHSYMTTNGFLQSVSAQAEALLAHLHAVTERDAGGWDAALATARIRRAQAAAHPFSPDSGTETPNSVAGSGSPTSAGAQSPGTPQVGFEGDGTTTSYIDARAAVSLRRRLVAASERADASADAADASSPSDEPTPPLPTGTTDPGASLVPSAPGPAGAADGSGAPPALHVLVHHPSELVADLAREYSELEGELYSAGPAYVRWPANIGWRNFATYMLIPTLVYELEYPRTDRIRPLYVFEKTVATFGTFALLYTVTESFILPYTPTSDQSFFRSLLDLALPFMVAYLLLFYLIFECICNGFAELSYFADRQFYEDWWNSTSWDEFSRKWNKPVHTFLLRHVYASTISSYHLSRGSAMFLTFLLSAAVHELVMAIVTQKIRMYLFALQLIQIPLIAVGRLPAIKRNKLMGNIVFWLGLYAGFPLLCVAYCAY